MYQVMTDWRVSNGTCLVGLLKATYGELRQAFGKPLEISADGKTRAEWVILFDTPEGEVVDGV